MQATNSWSRYLCVMLTFSFSGTMKRQPSLEYKGPSAFVTAEVSALFLFELGHGAKQPGSNPY